MRALPLLLLCPFLVLAQPEPPAGNCAQVSAACRASQFNLVAGNKLVFNFSTNTTWINASATTAGMAHNSGVANSGTNVAYIFDTTNSISGTTLLLSFRNATSEKFSITDDGIANAAKYYQASEGYGPGSNSPLAQGMAFSGSNTAINVAADAGLITFAAASGLNFGRITSNGFFTTSALNPVPVVHAAQTTSAVAMEFGRAAASAGGALAVTFATAFASAPACVCVDENAAPVDCGITTAPNTTGVTFTIGSARADTVDWQCIGAK